MRVVATSASDERGFALALVVLLLFAIGVAGATGYQVVRTEAQLALQTHEGIQALAIARAGLQRFVAEEVGEPADTVVYVLNGGEALVTSRKLYDLPTLPDELYLITSVGSYADPRAETTPAIRTVRQYAVRRGSPLNRIGALIALSGNVRIDDVGNPYSPVVDGTNTARNNECDEANLGPDTTGIVWVDGLTIADLGDVDGSRDSVSYADSAALATALDLPWDLLKDPGFPVGEFDDVWPNFALLPADSFPLIRVNGDFSPTALHDGRGALIVTGTFSPSYSFAWEGIVMAGDFEPPTGGGPQGIVENTFTVNGILAVGLNGRRGGGRPMRIREGGRILYNFCWVLAAGRSLAHLELVDGTWSEGM